MASRSASYYSYVSPKDMPRRVGLEALPPPKDDLFTHNWMTPLCNEAHIHGRTGWNARPLTRADLLSNFVSMAVGGFFVVLCLCLRAGRSRL